MTDFDMLVYQALAFANIAAKFYVESDSETTPSKAARLRYLAQDAHAQSQQLVDQLWAGSDVRPAPVSTEIDKIIKRMKTPGQGT